MKASRDERGACPTSGTRGPIAASTSSMRTVRFTPVNVTPASGAVETAYVRLGRKLSAPST